MLLLMPFAFGPWTGKEFLCTQLPIDGRALTTFESGATHFTHWFQPQTGTTAEKHDSFLTLKTSISNGLEEVCLIYAVNDCGSFLRSVVLRQFVAPY